MQRKKSHNEATRFRMNISPVSKEHYSNGSWPVCSARMSDKPERNVNVKGES